MDTSYGKDHLSQKRRVGNDGRAPHMFRLAVTQRLRSTSHSEKHRCSGCGKATYGAQACPRAGKGLKQRRHTTTVPGRLSSLFGSQESQIPLHASESCLKVSKMVSILAVPCESCSVPSHSVIFSTVNEMRFFNNCYIRYIFSNVRLLCRTRHPRLVPPEGSDACP
jgi:hypothetical protein